MIAIAQYIRPARQRKGTLIPTVLALAMAIAGILEPDNAPPSLKPNGLTCNLALIGPVGGICAQSPLRNSK